MIEQIKDALHDAEMFGPSLTHQEWLVYLIGEVERKDKEREELEGDMIHRFQMMELKIAEQKELIDRIQKQVMWGDAHQTSWKIRTWIEEFQKGDETK